MPRLWTPAPDRFRRAARAVVALACALGVVVGGIAPPMVAAEPAPVAAASNAAAGESDLYAAVHPRYRAEIRRATEGRLPVYRIAATVEADRPEEPVRIVGHLALDYVHDDPEPQPALFLRLYPNAPAYGVGAMSVSGVAVDGAPVETAASVDDTALRVPLEPPLPAGARARLTLDFVTTIPVDSDTGFGIFSVNPAAGSISAGHWHPMVAGRDRSGWGLEPVSPNGDVIFTDTALYDVALTVPDGLRPVVSGVEVARTPDLGATTYRYVTGPSRDAALALDDDWVAAELEVDGVRVVSYAAPDDAEGSIRAARHAAEALRVFGERFGPYPYRTLSVVQMDLAGAVGMEFPQLIAVDAGLYGKPSGSNPNYAEFVVAHEVAHQWWFGLVGNNQNKDAFLDEGLAELSAAYVYFRDRYGEEAAQEQMDRQVREWYLNRLFDRGDVTAHLPSDAYADRAAYGAAVYPKAALGFDAIRHEIGDEAFYAALRAYAADFRFAVAAPDDLRRAFNDACRCSIDADWNHWFAERNGADDFSRDDLAALRQ